MKHVHFPKRLLTILLVLVMLLGLTACSSNNAATTSGGSTETAEMAVPADSISEVENAEIAGSKDQSAESVNATSDPNPWHITWWIPRGEDTSYYMQYEENPVIQYIEHTYTFNGHAIDIDFDTAPPGSESDDFNLQISTGDYCGVIDMGMATMKPAEMLEEKLIWDLTDLIPEHMPNFMAYMNEHPEMWDYMYTYINGEPRLLYLRGFKSAPDYMFEGYLYRRDWIVKYGTNPTTGEPFTGGYADSEDVNSWTDDVVFPSGGSDPIYISDWEWMFEIFTKAMGAEGITDGYCFAPYYSGYLVPGDLYSSFGGGAPDWYFNADTGSFEYGVLNDNMRAYLQCLNTWYQKGWIDRRFDEHTSDMFFAIDTPSVFGGKVGLWQGRQSTTGAQIAGEDELTKGIMAFGCAQPINDMYGSEAQQNKAPNHYFQYSKADSYVVLTNKLSQDEVIAVMEFADLLFDPSLDMRYLVQSGLNKEQYEAVKPELYTRLGLTEGAYDIVDEKIVPRISTTATEWTAIRLARVPTMLNRVELLDYGFDKYTMQAVTAWSQYPVIDSVPATVLSAVTTEDSQTISRVSSTITQFLSSTLPAMIKGEGYDIWDDQGWSSFQDACVKRRCNTVTEIYQSIYDTLHASEGK